MKRQKIGLILLAFLCLLPHAGYSESTSCESCLKSVLLSFKLMKRTIENGFNGDDMYTLSKQIGQMVIYCLKFKADIVDEVIELVAKNLENFLNIIKRLGELLVNIFDPDEALRTITLIKEDLGKVLSTVEDHCFWGLRVSTFSLGVLSSLLVLFYLTVFE